MKRPVKLPNIIVGLLLLMGSALLISSLQGFLNPQLKRETVKEGNTFTPPEKLPSPPKITSAPTALPLSAKKIKTAPILPPAVITPPPSQTVTQTPTPTAKSTSASTQTQTVAPSSAVNLSISGSPKVSVQIPTGASQCDVLSKALEQSKISSLDMRYDPTYKTYAVYKINNLGKDNSVWWVYTVNGQEPDKGCSYVAANNGDNIEWKYLGS